MPINNKNVDRVGIIWGSGMRRVGLNNKTALQILRKLAKKVSNFKHMFSN